MPYVTPKTNWLSTDGVTTTDLNRIEGNIADIRSYGMGGIAGSIPGGDANLITGSGFYISVDSTLNSLGIGTIISVQRTATHAVQIFQPISSSPVQYRANVNGAWTAWTAFESTAGAQSKANTAETNAKAYAQNSIAIGSSADPNTTQEALILTSHANSPGGGFFWYIQTLFYSTLTGNRSQIATLYNAGSSRMFIRTYFTSSWSAWVEMENKAEAKLLVEHDSYKTARSAKDANGVYTVIEHRRKSDNTLVRKSTLSGGTSPQYTTRTVVFYAANGTTVVRTDTFTLTYDADGEYVSEV